MECQDCTGTELCEFHQNLWLEANSPCLADDTCECTPCRLDREADLDRTFDERVALGYV